MRYSLGLIHPTDFIHFEDSPYLVQLYSIHSLITSKIINESRTHFGDYVWENLLSDRYTMG